LPPEQCSPFWQVTPQPPQLLSSLSALTQLKLQHSWLL
jgi:hypothetical protein